MSAMEPLENTDRRYGIVAVLLHWLMAALLIMLVAIGLYMTSLPDAGFDRRKVVLIIFHKELGLLALGLVVLRLAWRVGNVLPSLVATLPQWQKVSARFVHLLFYGLMVALPLSGWLMSSATGIPVSFFGFFDLPDLVGYDERLFRTLIRVHQWLAYAMVACIAVHAAAALRHHLMLKDETLRKMLPGARG